MCSVFGYIATSRNGVSLSVLEKMARANVGRGPHAFGFAWVSRDGKLRCYKQPGCITNHLDKFAMIRDAVMVIGHVRWATHGEPGENLNNHPHPVDGGWLVHNGVVHNYEELLASQEIDPVSQCDSEIFGLLTERASGSMAQRMGNAIGQTTGNCVVLALWSRPARLIVARAGNPLSVGVRDDGRYFSTLPEGLPSLCRVSSVADGSLTEYNFADGYKGVLNVRVHKIAGRQDRHFSSVGRAVRPITERGACDATPERGAYRGG